MSTEHDDQRPLILLVEPEWPARAYLNAALEETGFRVQPAATATAALQWELATGAIPQLIVLDVGALSPNDQQAAQRLVQLIPSAPVLLLTRSTVLPDHTFLMRATRILRRPFSIDDVITAVCAITRGESG